MYKYYDHMDQRVVFFVFVELGSFMKTLNIGTESDQEEDGHSNHDHSGARQRTRRSHEEQMENTTWDQVYKTKMTFLSF